MQEYEKIFKDLKGIFREQLKSFTLAFNKSGKDPDTLVNDEVDKFLIDTINANIEDISQDNNKALQVMVSIFMLMLVNNIEEENYESDESEEQEVE